MSDPDEGEVQPSDWSVSDFERVFTRCHPSVHRFVVARVGRSHAEDVTAEVFAEAWRSRARFNPDAGNVNAWVFGIANNLTKRHHRTLATRRRAIARLGVAPDPAFDEDALLARVSAPADLEQALGQLDDLDREIVMLVAYGSLSMHEIADVVGMPVGTVKSRLSRARERIRSATDGQGGER